MPIFPYISGVEIAVLRGQERMKELERRASSVSFSRANMVLLPSKKGRDEKSEKRAKGCEKEEKSLVERSKKPEKLAKSEKGQKTDKEKQVKRDKKSFFSHLTLNRYSSSSQSTR